MSSPLWERVTYLYRAYDPAGALIYVGISDRWERRFKLHRKQSPWWKRVWHFTIEQHADRAAAFAAESWDIQKLAPAMNFEAQAAHVPVERPVPLVSFSRRLRRSNFNGDEIEAEALGENPFDQT